MPRGETTPQGAVPRCLRLPCPGGGGGAGGGGPASPGSSAAEIGESPEEGGEGARPSCGRKTSFPSLPPSRGRPGLSRPQQPGSELPRPADRLLQRSWDWGAGYGEDTDSWGARRRRALDSGGGAPARALRQDTGSAPAPCRGKCATGWREKSQVQLPEPAGLKREHPKDA